METKEFNLWEPQSKNSWLEQVIKDNPILEKSEHFRVIEEGILANYFAFPTDVKTEGHVLKNTDANAFWKIGISLKNKDLQKLKISLDIALENGVEYIHVMLPESITKDQFSQLIENVYLELITSRWSAPSNAILLSCNELIEQKFGKVNAFFDVNNLSNHAIQPVAQQAEVFSFHAFQVSTWAKILMDMLNYLAVHEKFQHKIIFQIYLTNDFLLNICAVRALKLVLNKIWHVFELKPETYFEATIDDKALSMDIHSNIYKIAVISLSAAIAGVDFLVLPPADIHTNASDMQWIKTSLHTQHILKQESRLSTLLDPLAGAYFVEELTEQIAGQLWMNLQEILRND